MTHESLSRLAACVPVVFLKERRTFIAHIPSLDLSASGTTMERAERALRTSVRLFLEELVEAGTLEMVLLDLGWIKGEDH